MKSQDNNGCFNICSSSLRTARNEAGSNPFHNFFRIASDYVLAMTVTLFFILFFPNLCFSQESIPLTYRVTQVGYGISNIYDSYLSPLKYTGSNIGLHYEQMKNTGLMNGTISAQHLINANYSWSKNNTKSASYYTGLLEYNYGLLYNLKRAEKLQVLTGIQAGGLVGFVYNTRNGNNPATGKAHIDLSLSGIVNYKLKIRSQPVNLRYQLSLPFVGAMYSPQFGQSYYEIGLGVTDDLVHFASFHNYFSARNILSAEIPLNAFNLLFSYHFSFYETRINDLDTRLINNTFFVGFSSNFFIVKGKQKKDNYQYVY